MLYASYEEQRSFPEYVDFVMMEIYFSSEEKEGEYPIRSSEDLAYLILSGYWPVFEDMPKDIAYGLEWNRPPKRRLKRWCEISFEKYGEREKVKEIIKKRNDKVIEGMIKDGVPQEDIDEILSDLEGYRDV